MVDLWSKSIWFTVSIIIIIMITKSTASPDDSVYTCVKAITHRLKKHSQCEKLLGLPKGKTFN